MSLILTLTQRARSGKSYEIQCGQMKEEKLEENLPQPQAVLFIPVHPQISAWMRKSLVVRADAAASRVSSPLVEVKNYESVSAVVVAREVFKGVEERRGRRFVVGTLKILLKKKLKNAWDTKIPVGTCV